MESWGWGGKVKRKTREKEGENRRVADIKTKRHPRNYFSGGQQCPLFAAVGC